MLFFRGHLRQATPTRGLKVIAQKIKAGVPHVHDFGLGRMQLQTFVSTPLTDQRQCLFCLGLAAAQNHEVIRIAYHLVSLGRHLVVQWIQIDVAQ